MVDMSAEDFARFLQEDLPSMLIALHDISSKKRKQTRSQLRSLCDRANSDYALQEALVSAAVSCLAGSSEGIRSGVVEFLGVCAYTLEDCEELKKRLTRIVLLLENKTPQMSRSVIKFLRLAAQGLRDMEVLNECFQYFIKSILGSDMARNACRVRIRTLIEKLGKRFGWNMLEQVLPEAHLRLFRYTKRMYNRRVRKAKERGAARDDDVEDDDSSVEDSESEDEKEEEQIVMRESIDRPVDLLSGRIPLVRKGDIVKSSLSKKTKSKIHSDGRLIVEELVVPEKPAKRMSLSDIADLRDKANAAKKAKIAERGSNGPASNMHSKKSSLNNKRHRRQHELTGLTQFAPKKNNAFGDAKRSQQDTDPFAYMRLNPSLIREKYKGNAIRSLAQVVRKTGEKAARSRAGRGGVAGGMFVQKPSFKKPFVQKPVKGAKKGGKIR